MTEYIDIVNEKDEVVGKDTRENVLKQGLLHRGVTIIVRNKEGKYLIMRRSAKLDAYPNMIDPRIAGRVSSGETYEETALRELEEEAGIKDIELKFVSKDKFKDESQNIFRTIFFCEYDGPIEKQDEEVQWIKFVEKGEIISMMENADFSPSGKSAFKEFLEKFNG